MARVFGFPSVAALEIGGSCFVEASASEVKRKCALYGGRNNKRFEVTRDPGLNGGGAIVKRLPVTDSELPGA